MTKLDDALSGVTRLAFDTSPVIYFVEAHPKYDALVTDIFQRVADGRIIGVASVITLSEVLVQPIQQNNASLRQSYRELLLHSDNFELFSINEAIAESAADLRARYRLRTPDALQIANAIDAACEAFLTNDATLKRVNELRVLTLDEMEI
ncbi:MAG TPA: type II toxin-antitoxin system VapC family toxin [Pyrinomonadaceae bacterium]|nr:type II toxin-antitoxin system VapC family toxin [Pyrinomonadaceae bacterium]